MVDTVKIGNSWYVLEDICGIVGEQADGSVKMLMRGGHILTMTDLSPEVVEHIRQLRDPAKGQPSLTQMPPDMEARMQALAATPAPAPAVDMSPETVIDVPAEKPA